jgi:hypothetical protein
MKEAHAAEETAGRHVCILAKTPFLAVAARFGITPASKSSVNKE